MNNYLVVDAITEMDTDIIAEYLEMKKDLLSNLKKKRIWKINWKGWATLAACFILVVTSVLFVVLMNQTNKPSNSETSGIGYNYGLGEIFANYNWNGSKHSLVFN